MIKRLISLSMFVLAAVCSAKAQTNPNAIVFEMKDGSAISYMFEEMPKVYFTTEDIIITTQQYETAYQQNSVLRYLFVCKDLTSISTPLVKETRMVGDMLSINNLSTGTSVYVHSTDGKQLMAGKADAEGCVTLSLSSFPIGVYLVKYSNKTVKIRKS